MRRPSAGTQLSGGLARGEVAEEEAVADDGGALGGDALVVEAEAAEAAGDGGVGGEVDDVGAVTESAELVGG